MANPLCVPLLLVWQYHKTHSKGLEYSASITEALTANDEGTQAYWFYRYPKANRVPIHRMTGIPGDFQAYASHGNSQRGSRHHSVELLGYVSTVQKEGMIPLNLRWAHHLPEDSRGQADFRDFEFRKFYAYPAFGYWIQGPFASRSLSKELTLGDLIYSSANYKHTIVPNKFGPHLYRWNVTDTATGLDLDLVNIGGVLGDLTTGGGLGRGVQLAFGFQDFEGFEGSDPADNVCLTVHNPTQAGSQTGTVAFHDDLDSGATQAGSIVTAYEAGADFVDMTVMPMDFVEGPPIGGPPPANPYPTPPAPCATEWHGQPGVGEDQCGAGLWEDLRIRQRWDLDWQGREGVHKVTYEFYTPVDITSYAWTPATQGMFNFFPAFHLNNAFDDGYVYDPVNHAAPIHMNPYTIPGLSGRGLTVTGFKDFWAIAFHATKIVGVAVAEDVDCTFVADQIVHVFPGPPTLEPRIESRRGACFLKSRFPAAAGPNDKFGIGVAGALKARGPWDSIGYHNQRSAICFPGDYTVVDRFTANFTSLGANLQLLSPVGGSVVWPAGTFTAELFYIMDTFANFQGHIDWLEAQGLI